MRRSTPRSRRWATSIGAVGALESVLTMKAVEEGVIPPTLNLDNLDPECGDIDVVAGKPAKATTNTHSATRSVSAATTWPSRLDATNRM